MLDNLAYVANVMRRRERRWGLSYLYIIMLQGEENPDNPISALVIRLFYISELLIKLINWLIRKARVALPPLADGNASGA
jgi:hypothetical protein